MPCAESDECAPRTKVRTSPRTGQPLVIHVLLDALLMQRFFAFLGFWISTEEQNFSIAWLISSVNLVTVRHLFNLVITANSILCPPSSLIQPPSLLPNLVSIDSANTSLAPKCNWSSNSCCFDSLSSRAVMSNISTSRSFWRSFNLALEMQDVALFLCTEKLDWLGNTFSQILQENSVFGPEVLGFMFLVRESRRNV